MSTTYPRKSFRGVYKASCGSLIVVLCSGVFFYNPAVPAQVVVAPVDKTIYLGIDTAGIPKRGPVGTPAIPAVQVAAAPATPLPTAAPAGNKTTPSNAVPPPAPIANGSTNLPRYPIPQTVTKQPAQITMPRPAYLQSTPIPGLDTSISRVTDADAFWSVRRTYRHVHSRIQPWNSDGSLILLANELPNSLLDGKTFKLVQSFIGPAGAVWANTDPDILYGVGFTPASFIEYRVSTKVTRVLRIFPEYTAIFLGGGQGNLSNDDRYFALFGKRSDAVDILVYDVRDNVIVSKKAFPGVKAPHADLNWTSVSPSGLYVVVHVHGATKAFDVYDSQTMKFLRRLRGGCCHADIGYDSDGNEVIVSAINSSAITSIRLKDGVVKEQLAPSHAAFNFSISCRNTHRPGYCYIGTYAHFDGFHQYMYREIYSLKLDGSGRVERFAQNFAADLPVGDLQYQRIAQAVPNRDGSQVLFASDWRDPSTAAVIHSYVVGVR